MPDYTKPDLNAGTIPPKPRNIDEAAQASERNEQRRQEGERQVSKEWDQRNEQRRADAQRQLDKTKEPPPSMRLYGRDRMVNIDQGRNPDRSQPIKEMSPAQREMMTKLKAAREADRQQTRTAYDDQQYVKLREKPQPDRPEAKKELTPAQQQMVKKMDAAREADREQARAKAPEKPPPDRSR